MHSDHRDFKNTIVASLSLGTDWPMRFRSRGGAYHRTGLHNDQGR